MDIRNELTELCLFPSIWNDKGPDGKPVSEMAYYRCDHDGYRWWNTVWPVNREIETRELVTELESVYEGFINAFPSRTAMEKYCMQNLDCVSSDGTEYNAYLDLDGPGFYWLRIITRKGDYNLYLHCFSKAIFKATER